MRRATLLVLATIAGMLLTTGVAFAANLFGTSGNDVIYGTTYADTIDGKGGADALYGKGDKDTLYGGEGNDNFLNKAVDSSGIEKIAGLRGSKGADKVYGQAGDDDVIGNDGNDNPLDDSSPKNINDWDRAFGGSGNDTINVADGDTRDEVSCGENIESPDGGTDDKDIVKIDVVRDSSGKITAADTVHEKDWNGNSVKCEEIKDQGNKVVPQDQLPHSDSAVAAVEPSEQ